MTDDEYIAVVHVRFGARSLQSAARAVEAAVDETDWVGSLDGVEGFEAEAVHVGRTGHTEAKDD